MFAGSPPLLLETHVKFFFKNSQAPNDRYDLSAANCPEKFSLLVNNERVEISKNEFLENIVALFIQTVQQIKFPLSQFADEVWFTTTDIKVCNNMISTRSLEVSSGVFSGEKIILLSIPSHTVLLNCKSKTYPLSPTIGEKNQLAQSCILQFQQYMSQDYNEIMNHIKNKYDTQPMDTKKMIQYYMYAWADPFIFVSGGMIQAAITHELGHIINQDNSNFFLLHFRIKLAKLCQIILTIITPILCGINWYFAQFFYPIHIFSTIAISVLIFSAITIIICECLKIANYHFLRRIEENADAYVAKFPALKSFSAMKYKVGCASDYFYAMAFPKWFGKIREAINYLYRTHPTNEQRYRFFARPVI